MTIFSTNPEAGLNGPAFSPSHGSRDVGVEFLWPEPALLDPAKAWLEGVRKQREADRRRGK